MFSKEERKAIHTEYWKRFKSYISSSKSAEGRKINWLNYPTQLKEIYVRLDVNNSRAVFSIDIQSTDPGVRALIWEQFQELKKVFENEMEIPGVWNENAINKAEQPIGTIYWTLENVNIYSAKDEAKVFSFFKDKLIRFDRFYSVYKEVLFGLIK